MGHVAIVSEGGLFLDLLDRIASGQAEDSDPSSLASRAHALPTRSRGPSQMPLLLGTPSSVGSPTQGEPNDPHPEGLIEPLLERLGFDLVTQRTIQIGSDSYPIAYQAGEAEAAPRPRGRPRAAHR